MTLRVGIVAAEPSGDLLAAGLMGALRTRFPRIEFEGIGGSRMQGQGMHSWEPMEQLSVMGLVEVVKHLPSLLALRRQLIKRWLDRPPALFIGIDAPDFNLTLERHLRENGIVTVHYVSPTVWAWRPKRVIGVRRAVDLLLSIFPFETDFLRKHNVPVEYVGHPLAAGMPMQPDRAAARQALGLADDEPVLALLPGSRLSEVEKLARPFLQAVQLCRKEIPSLRVVCPLISERTREAWHLQLRQWAPELEITELLNDSGSALAAADVVLTASGTATFEALLSKRPMVVGYKVNALTYRVVSWLNLVQVKHVAMANLLDGEGLAPEFIQHECEPVQLAAAVLDFFRDPALVKRVQQRYCEVHRELLMDTNQIAADAIARLLQEKGIV